MEKPAAAIKRKTAARYALKASGPRSVYSLSGSLNFLVNGPFAQQNKQAAENGQNDKDNADNFQRAQNFLSHSELLYKRMPTV